MAVGIVKSSFFGAASVSERYVSQPFGCVACGVLWINLLKPTGYVMHQKV